MDEPVPEGAGPLLRTGLNPLVQAASPLLLLAGQLRGAVSVSDVDGLRRNTLVEIRRFEEQARFARIATETVTAARYALCSALDEAVLSTPWGAHSAWAQSTLLVEMHGEAVGGEKFFDVLDGLVRSPRRHLDLIELYYLCLSLGFEGKYGLINRGHEQLDKVRERVGRLIRTERGAPPPELSVRWRGVEDRRNPVFRYGLWWLIPVMSLAVLGFVWVVLWASLGQESGAVRERLATVGFEDFYEPRILDQLPGPTIQELLEEQEDAGLLDVDEVDGRTTVVLTATNLFGSGQATLNPAQEPLLLVVTEAIERVPGSVTVVGHTDSIPPSPDARYASNQLLSEARAENVAGRIRDGLSEPSRVQALGRGASEPRVSPPSAAENRRVEIVHLPPLAE